MSDKWFIKKEDGVFGPVSADDLQNLIKNGRITLDQEASQNEAGPWEPLKSYELFKEKPRQIEEMLEDEDESISDENTEAPTFIIPSSKKPWSIWKIVIITIVLWCGVSLVITSSSRDTAEPLKVDESSSAQNANGGKDCYALVSQNEIDIKVALSTCSNELKENPNDIELHYILGMLYKESEDYKSSYRHLRKAVNGNYNEALFQFALLHTYSEEYGLKPKKQRLSGELSSLFIQLGMDSNDETFKEAVRLYNLVLDRNPKDTRAMRMLAHHYNERRGVPAAWAGNKAKKWYAKAAALGDKEAENILELWEAQERDYWEKINAMEKCPDGSTENILLGGCNDASGYWHPN